MSQFDLIDVRSSNMTDKIEVNPQKDSPINDVNKFPKISCMFLVLILYATYLHKKLLSIQQHKSFQCFWFHFICNDIWATS